MDKFWSFLFYAGTLKQATMNQIRRFSFGLPFLVFGLIAVSPVSAQSPIQGVKVFQAAGPNASLIQSTIGEFRTALGGDNNANKAGPLATGRREINWDGGGSTTTVSGSPLDQFLGIRGARFTTTGAGFIQAPPSGLATFFTNPQYSTIFKAFSPQRLFSPVGSNVHDTLFFVPGGGGPATTRGFGVVFSDLDLPDGSGPSQKLGNRHASTLIEYFGVNGQVLFSSFAPSSPGDGNFSFFGIVLRDPLIARVRITAGAIPGQDDSRTVDVVMMDDFIYGEPQLIH